jgi:quercetin dioxygenase-like cupin family protein
MRALIASVDDQGRSCIAREAELAFEYHAGGPMGTSMVAATETCPPPAAPPGHAGRVDLGVPPGLVRWLVVDFPPGSSAPLHHTDSVDLVFVFEGSADLILDDGAHPVGPGDCVMLKGVDHGWQAGPDGCRISSVVVGTPATE